MPCIQVLATTLKVELIDEPNKIYHRDYIIIKDNSST